MKNQTILSLLTAGAIVATSAASFAAWDTTTGTSNGTLNVANPVDITTQNMNAFTAGTRNLNAAPEYTSTVTFDVTTSSLVNTLTLDTDIKDGGTSVKGDFDVSYEKASAAVTNGVDSAVADGENTYTVKITPKDTAAEKKLTGKDLTVEVTGTLSKTGA